MALPFDSTRGLVTGRELTFRDVLTGGDQVQHTRANFDVVLLAGLFGIRPLGEGGPDLADEVLRVEGGDDLREQSGVTDGHLRRTETCGLLGGGRSLQLARAGTACTGCSSRQTGTGGRLGTR